MQRVMAPLIFGVVGCAILATLGVWQLGRFQWKAQVIAQIESRLDQPTAALPANPNPERDEYMPVGISGMTVGDNQRVLISLSQIGPAYRLVSAFDTESGRRILIDLGWVPIDRAVRSSPESAVRIEGNLHWPDEADRWTPTPDLEAGMWFARDVPAMARALETEPVLVVVKSMSGTDPRATPLPVTAAGIPNNHLGYALQWFGLAIIWAGMTGFLIWRIHRRTV